MESSTCLPRWLEIKRTGDGVSSPVSAMSYSRDHHHKTSAVGGIYKTLLLLLLLRYYYYQQQQLTQYFKRSWSNKCKWNVWNWNSNIIRNPLNFLDKFILYKSIEFSMFIISFRWSWRGYIILFFLSIYFFWISISFLSLFPPLHVLAVASFASTAVSSI
jgi:hypothetical protein